MWQFSWKVLVYLALIENQAAKIIVRACVGRLSDSLTKEIQIFQRFKFPALPGLRSEL